jgi:hypothetical protein
VNADASGERASKTIAIHGVSIDERCLLGVPGVVEVLPAVAGATRLSR